MEASKTVWRGLVAQFKALVPGLHGHQAKTLSLWVYGALVAGSVRIPAGAEALLLGGVTDVQLPSVERRFTRWLSNPRLHVEGLWKACLGRCCAGGAAWAVPRGWCSGWMARWCRWWAANGPR